MAEAQQSVRFVSALKWASRLGCLLLPLTIPADAAEVPADLDAYCATILGARAIAGFDRRDNGLLCSQATNQGRGLLHHKVDPSAICQAQHGTAHYRKEGPQILCLAGEESPDPGHQVDLAEYCRSTYGPSAIVGRRLPDDLPLCTVQGTGGLSQTHYAINLGELCGQPVPPAATEGDILDCGAVSRQADRGGEGGEAGGKGRGNDRRPQAGEAPPSPGPLRNDEPSDSPRGAPADVAGPVSSAGNLQPLASLLPQPLPVQPVKGPTVIDYDACGSLPPRPGKPYTRDEMIAFTQSLEARSEIPCPGFEGGNPVDLETMACRVFDRSTGAPLDRAIILIDSDGIRTIERRDVIWRDGRPFCRAVTYRSAELIQTHERRMQWYGLYCSNVWLRMHGCPTHGYLVTAEKGAVNETLIQPAIERGCQPTAPVPHLLYRLSNDQLTCFFLPETQILLVDRAEGADQEVKDDLQFVGGPFAIEVRLGRDRDLDEVSVGVRTASGGETTPFVARRTAEDPLLYRTEEFFVLPPATSTKSPAGAVGGIVERLTVEP